MSLLYLHNGTRGFGALGFTSFFTPFSAGMDANAAPGVMDGSPFTGLCG